MPPRDDDIFLPDHFTSAPGSCIISGGDLYALLPPATAPRSSPWNHTLQPFPKELAVEFLRKGFEEAGVRMDFDPLDVVEKVGGIPGYLVMFGVKYMKTNDVEKALNEVFSTMKTLFEKELEELDKRSRRYRVILKLVSSGVRNWASFKKYFASTGNPISDLRLHSILQTFEKMSILEKTESGYRVSDPVLEEILKGN